MHNTVITEAGPEDADALSKLGITTFVDKFGHLYRDDDLRHFLETAHSPAFYTEALMVPVNKFWRAIDGSGALVGYAMAGKMTLPVDDASDDTLELKRLYIAAPHQSAGLGARMMSAVFEWVESQGNPDLYLSVFSENEGAQRFYGRYGFRRVGSYEFLVGTHRDLEYILLLDRTSAASEAT
ncbi:MAG: GNAT family N-acetyltransferase [Proteobacteria bacterium]|nr:GNAT family N-acetyltransferase [Pseudomonadota bacterium]